MKQSEVKVGEVYQVKVTGKLARVRIDGEHQDGGWTGTNLETNRPVRIKTAAKLRRRVSTTDGSKQAAEAVKEHNLTEGVDVPMPAAKKKLTKKQRQAMRAQSEADQENARVRDERAASPDGMTASERAMAAREPDRSRRQLKKTGCLDAAVHVLEEAGEPLTCGQMMEQILERGLWITTGRTPSATLYSAILREIQRKGDDARFVLAERGKFTLKR